MNRPIAAAATLALSAILAGPAAALGVESHQPFPLAANPGDYRGTVDECDPRPFVCALNLIQRRETQAALPILRRAAARGTVPALRAIALIYLRGEGDVPQDLALAVHWFQAAARQGDAESMYTLGVMYRRGYAVEANQAEAITWLQRAADAGYTRAGVALRAM